MIGIFDGAHCAIEASHQDLIYIWNKIDDYLGQIKLSCCKVSVQCGQTRGVDQKGNIFHYKSLESGLYQARVLPWNDLNVNTVISSIMVR